MEENLRLDSRQAHSGRWLDSSPTRPPAVREYNLSAQLLARRSFWVGWLGLRLYVQLIRLRCSHKQAAMAGSTEDGVPPQSRRGFAWGGRVIKKNQYLVFIAGMQQNLKSCFSLRAQRKPCAVTHAPRCQSTCTHRHASCNARRYYVHIGRENLS